MTRPDHEKWMSELRKESALLGARAERDAAIKQRDRALALLRATEQFVPEVRCDTVNDDNYLRCGDDEPCWEHRRRAILAEVDS